MEKIYLSYPDFKWGETIDPEEIDVNNADIVAKINEVVDMLNSLFENEDGGVVEIELRGSVVKITPIEPFTSDNVEDFLGELITRLRSNIEGVSGASLIGSSEIVGISGSNVQDQLKSLHELVKTIVAEGSTSAELALHIKSDDHDERYYTKTEIDTTMDTLDGVLEDVNADLTALDTRLKTLESKPGGGGMSIIDVRESDPIVPIVGQMWMVVESNG